MSTYKVLFSYSGEKYWGYQIQKGGPTLQNELQKVLSQYLKEDVKVTASGRTDAGVHASGQIIHFKSKVKIDPDKLVNILNFYLPRDIFIKKVFLKNDDFHARYDAKVRHYRYHLIDTNQEERESHNKSYYPYGEINLLKLMPYFKVFEGVHDFSTFCSSKDGSKSKIREIFKIDGYRQDGKEIIIDLYGNGFLMNMVRKIIGTVLYFYRKEKPLWGLQELLEMKDPKETRHLVEAKGLFLQNVYYSPIFGRRDYYER